MREKLHHFFHSIKLRTVLFALFTLPVNSYTSQVQYPIQQLGNCANQAECYAYCQVWEHTPICWSYQKYLMKNNVLGESTESGTQTSMATLKFPIPELGNCKNIRACAVFCDNPINQTACTNFGKEKGLIQVTPIVQNSQVFVQARQTLGCINETSCRTLCEQPAYHDRCVAFARSQGLIPQITTKPTPTIQPELFIATQQELGCNTQDTCAAFCSIPTNRSACNLFALTHSLIKPTHIPEKKSEVLQEAQKEFGCTSIDSCSTFCSVPENQPKCIDLAKRFGKVVQIEPTRLPLPSSRPLTPSPMKMYREMDIRSTPVPTQELQMRQETVNESETEDEGLTEPTKIPTRTPTIRPTEVRLISPTRPPAGGLLPSGCTTDDQCKQICEANPGLCPGFPLIPTRTTTPTMIPTRIPSPTRFPTEVKSPTKVPTLIVITPTKSVSTSGSNSGPGSFDSTRVTIFPTGTSSF
jgi:hypothetical protein